MLRVGRQLPVERRSLQQFVHAAADQAAGGFVAGHGDLHEQGGEFHFRYPLPVDFLVDQQGDQVVPALVLALTGQLEAIGTHRHAGLVDLLRRSAQVGVRGRCLQVGPPTDLRPHIRRDIQQGADDGGGQVARKALHEIDLPGIPRTGHDLPGDPAHCRLQLFQHARGETGDDGPAEGAVLRRIHAQQLVAGHLQDVRWQVVHHDEAPLRGKCPEVP